MNGDPVRPGRTVDIGVVVLDDSAQTSKHDAVVTEDHALVTFDPSSPAEAPWEVEDRVPRASASLASREHVIVARKGYRG